MIRAAPILFKILFQSFSKLQVARRSYCFSRKLSSIEVAKLKLALEFLLHVFNFSEKKA